MVAVKVNNYEENKNKLLTENNSLSKFTTFLRTYELFFSKAEKVLKK